MKKLTIAEMTEPQKIRVRTRLAQEQKKLGRPLTNAEQNKVKDQIITEISKEVDAAAAKVRAQKKRIKSNPAAEQKHTAGQRKPIRGDYAEPF